MPPILHRSLRVSISVLAISLAGCGTCGWFVYCAYDGSNPPPHIFTVRGNGTVLVGHLDRSGSTFATEGRYAAGTHTVWVAIDGDDEDEGLGESHPFQLTGKPGDEFLASCFQYNGGTFLRFFTEVLTGFEIIDRRTGAVVAKFPSGTVTRRSNYC